MQQNSKRLGRAATIAVMLIILAIIVASGYLTWLCIALSNRKNENLTSCDETISLPTVDAVIMGTAPTDPETAGIADTSTTPLTESAAEETEITTELATIQTEPEINAENWKQAYYDFIIKDAAESEYSKNNNVDYFSYHLVYLDEDEIPELWINYIITAAGCRLVTVSDGEIHDSLLGCGWISYSDYQNTFCYSYGKTGSPTIYSLEHGSLVKLAGGAQYAETYIWDDISVSKEVYYQNLYKYIDLESAKDTMQPEYTYSEILEYLSDKRGT